MRRTLVITLLLLASCASSPHVGPGQTSPNPTGTEVSQAAKPLLRFAVIGDFGAGTDAQYQLAQKMCRWWDGHRFNLVITTGDNVYPGGERENFDEHFFTPYECLFDRGVRFRATLGNHDIVTDNGRPELAEDAFGLKDRNYIVRRKTSAGPVVRFVMWESNYSNRRWLRRHLGRDRWTVVSFHHPVVSPGPHGNTPGYRPSLPRLFARKGVDLVVNGHDHLYARMPARRRVRYVVTGGGGAGLYSCDRPKVAVVCVERHHFLYVRAFSDRLEIRAVPIEGRAFDRFTTRGRP